MTFQDMVANRQRLIDRTAVLFETCKKGDGFYLNLGCGASPREGMVNVDRYADHPGVLRMDMTCLDVEDGTVDLIYSSHSLEHLPLRRSRIALRDWYRALRPGGILFLSMPDLDLIMRMLLGSPDVNTRHWLLYTLFGYQADMQAPREDDTAAYDPGQVHMSGHSQATLTAEMLDIGYTIKDTYQYEGYGTPGVFVEACRPFKDAT